MIKDAHQMTSAEEMQHRVFDHRHFVDNASLVVNRLATYLADDSLRGLDLRDPEQLRAAAQELMLDQHASLPEFDTGRLQEIVDLFIATGLQMHSPGAMGRQFTGIVPLSAAIDLVGSIVNQPASFYEAGQLPNVAERIMAEELNRFVGYDPEQFVMVTTSGGSLAALTAMLAARNHSLPDFWQHGCRAVEDGQLPAVMISEEVHYSISRAVSILGIGADQVVKLPIDDKRRIRVDGIAPALAAARKRGLKVFYLAATVGTTPVGAIDPIDAIADVTEEHGIWLHVDGAQGGSMVVSDLLRPRLAGLERADSFVWDAHKLMFVSAPCSLLFYKDKARSFGAFHQEASYVSDEQPDPYSAYSSAEMNFECTKRPMIMGLWTAWALYGRSLFSKKIEYLCALTEEFYEHLLEQPDFRALHRPECNIICFRYQPHEMSGKLLSDLQLGIRNVLREGSSFFISKLDLDGVTALRVVFTSHRTTTEHYLALLEKIREVGSGLLKAGEAG